MVGKRDGSWDLVTSWSSQQRLERRVASVAAASGSMPDEFLLPLGEKLEMRGKLP